MNYTAFNPWILTLTAFLPAAGALLIALLLRRDRDVRIFSLAISVLTFLASLHLPAHYAATRQATGGLGLRTEPALGHKPEHSLSRRRGLHLDVAGGALHAAGSLLRAGLLEDASTSG